MSQLKIRAIVQGYQGEMLCVYAAMDEQTGYMLIGKADKFDPNMNFAPDLAILTNVAVLPTWTMFFKEEQLKDAIDAYHTLMSNELLDIDPSMQRYDPVSAIQVNGIKESGIEYRFSESVSNGHVAVLMCALFAEKQRKINSSLAAQVDLQNNSVWREQPNEDFVVKPVSVGYFF